MKLLGANVRCGSLRLLVHLPVALVMAAGTVPAHGQGTITFNARPYFDGTDYYELAMHFTVIVPTPGTGSPNHDYMGVAGPITTPSNIPYNSTPYMLFIQQNSPDDYVALSLTNGMLFGLTSVQLADAASPSLSLVPISFVGYLAGGSTVTNTFTTPGNGADHLLDYQFTAAFASGLTSVDILAPRWAMDNLVFSIPEPGPVALLGLGVLSFALRKRGHDADA